MITERLDKIPQARRAVRSLPLERWPEADRNVWAAACQPAARLKRGGAACHLKPVTRDTYMRHYGSFLGFLDRRGLLRMNAPAATNVTAENVDAYLTDIKIRLSSTTLHASIDTLRHVALLIAPKRNFEWLSEIGKDLALLARPRSKFDRLVSTESLLEAGLTFIHEAEYSRKLTKLIRAHQVRNGLMVAMLALCPIRRKNYAALEIGRSFAKINDTWWIILSETETKEKRADERPIDELLTPIVDRYISQHRPVLARSDKPHAALWLSMTDGTRVDAKQVANAIRQTTLSTVGVAVSPHMFRTAGASTAALYGGENPNLANALLHHTHPSVTNAHYNRAGCFSAGERLRQVVRQYQKT